jgi:hypothetical protein
MSNKCIYRFSFSGLAGRYQGCQIFLGTTYQNGKNTPNSLKIGQMAIYIEYQHLLMQDPPKFTPIGIFGLKICIPSGNPVRHIFILVRREVLLGRHGLGGRPGIDGGPSHKSPVAFLHTWTGLHGAIHKHDCHCLCQAGLPYFSRYKIPKREKIYQISMTYTKNI